MNLSAIATVDMVLRFIMRDELCFPSRQYFLNSLLRYEVQYFLNSLLNIVTGSKG